MLDLTLQVSSVLSHEMIAVIAWNLAHKVSPSHTVAKQLVIDISHLDDQLCIFPFNTTDGSTDIQVQRVLWQRTVCNADGCDEVARWNSL